jgi:glycosyltransferase involved in cell wall biosynthesis
VYDRSARDTLYLSWQAPPFTHAPWALFDDARYRVLYPEAPDVLGEALLEWYLTNGQTLGHSPNRYFDEAWQRRSWPGILPLIEAGSVASAFDAWCRGAHATRQPHWLFDPPGYLARYPALTSEVLENAGLANLYDHYLRFGAGEGRIGHHLFQPAVYLAALDPPDAEAAAAMPFAHYLGRLDRRAPDCRTSILFDPDWYRTRYPEAVRAVAEGQYASLLEHYLCNETPLDFDPSPRFSESYYLAQNPGLSESIGREGFRNGYAHFLAFGTREGRSPHPELDLAWYGKLPGVQAAIDAGLAPDAFSHWIAIGGPAGSPGRAPPGTQATEAQAVELFRRRAAAVWPLFGRHKLDFAFTGTPAVAVVMEVGNNIAETMATLASLHAQCGDRIEVILIASAPVSPDEDIETMVTGATIVRFGIPLSRAASRDAGVAAAAAPAILFLGDGLELAPGAIDAALARLNGDRDIGAVGARLVQAHGVLLEAGGIVWRDGQLHAYMRGSSPLAAEANFTRDVDFCSTLFLLAQRDAVAAPPDGAEAIAGTTHDAADFCARIHEAGLRVVYEPDALVFLTSHTPDPGEDGRLAFVAAHRDYLETRPHFDPSAVAGARSPSPRAILPGSPSRAPIRVLFIEDTIPLRRMGSGFVRSNDVLRAMAGSGAAVTVFPMRPSEFALSAIRAGLPDTIEAMHDESAAGFPGFLATRPDCYDLIWIARTHNLAPILDSLTRLPEHWTRPPKILVDTEAVASVRQAGQAALLDRAFDEEAALRHEFRDLHLASHAIATTEGEREIVRRNYRGPVSVLGHAIAAMPTPRSFEERAGLLFVGAFHDMAHPNYDGLAWFVDEVLPLIEQGLRWETRLTVAGYVAGDVSLDRFENHRRVTLRGPVPDLGALYDAHRVFVAPARFAAGLPYKVHEAAAFGVPVVATALLADQLGWMDGEEIGAAGIADPAGFAARVIALYRDAALWTRMREAALARVATELDPAGFNSRVSDLLRPRKPYLIQDAPQVQHAPRIQDAATVRDASRVQDAATVRASPWVQDAATVWDAPWFQDAERVQDAAPVPDASRVQDAATVRDAPWVQDAARSPDAPREPARASILDLPLDMVVDIDHAQDMELKQGLDWDSHWEPGGQ